VYKETTSLLVTTGTCVVVRNWWCRLARCTWQGYGISVVTR